ncbi:MAG: hypothetical protein ACTSXV_02530 [Alphaproteobacteria bacterium]
MFKYIICIFVMITSSVIAQYQSSEIITENYQESFYQGGQQQAIPQHTVNGTVYYPEKSYFVPYHVKQNKMDIPQITPPPVLWGEDLYYPYQLKEHVQFNNQGDLTQFMQQCAPGIGCTVRPAVICRRAGCTRLNDRMTKQYLFNSLINIFLSNNMSRVDLCEADPHSRACLANSIRFGGRIGGTPVLIQIPSFTLVEMNPLSQLNRLSLFISYDIYANGLKTRCSGAMTTIEAISGQQLIMRDNSYQCDLTSGAPTTAFSMYNIDYIDLDYGIIGAFYSIGLSGESAAGGTGYVLMKFKKTGLPSTDIHGFGAIVPEGNYTVEPHSKSEDECLDDCDEIIEEIVEVEEGEEYEEKESSEE